MSELDQKQMSIYLGLVELIRILAQASCASTLFRSRLCRSRSLDNLCYKICSEAYTVHTCEIVLHVHQLGKIGLFLVFTRALVGVSV